MLIWVTMFWTKKWLISMKYIPFFLLIFFSSLAFSSGSGTKSAVFVSCKVVRGKPKVVFQKSKNEIMFQYTKTLDKNVFKIGNINVTCSQGTVANITYDTAFYYKNSMKKSADQSTHAIKTIYSNKECTEVWEPGDEKTFTFSNKKQLHVEALYCKTRKKEINPKPDERVQLMTININY